MEKPFQEVFPGLKLENEIKALFDKVTVTKVAVASSKELLRVSVRSHNWIHKKHIYAVQKAIKEQCFPDMQMEVRVMEKYLLSEQYTAENFFPIYRDSILTELREYSIF